MVIRDSLNFVLNCGIAIADCFSNKNGSIDPGDTAIPSAMSFIQMWGAKYTCGPIIPGIFYKQQNRKERLHDHHQIIFTFIWLYSLGWM